MNYNSLTKEDKEWLSRTEDLSAAAETRKIPKFTKFCDERLLYLFNECAPKSYTNQMIWGGFSESERAVIGFFPDFTEPDSSLFPTSLLKISGAADCTHRDFLGSILGLGINRDMIGDILICDNNCFVFVYDTIKDFILLNLNKVANKRVSVTEENDISLLPTKKFEEICGTVSSIRLDCIVSLFTHKSRSDSQGLISAELVFVNHAVCTNSSMRPKEGDVISVRKFGKMRLLSIGGETKKGRIKITINKYV